MVTAETHAPTPMQCLVKFKGSQFREKKCRSSHCEIFVSCTSKGCDNVTALYYQFFAALSIKWSLTKVENKGEFKTLISKGGRGHSITGLL